MGFYIGNIEINNIYIGSTQVSNAYVGSNQIYSDVSVDAVMFIAKQSNSTVGLNKISTGQTLEYSYDGEDWSSMTTATTITLTNSGDTVYIRGTLTSNNTELNYTNFTMSGDIKLRGKLNTIWNYSDSSASLKEYCGYYLFNNCTALTEASGLVLPATSIAEHCYHNMFNSCTSLTTAPQLPATTLAESCYSGMFGYCTSLTTAPTLPATTLETYCYGSMFDGCTSLTTAPVLPATTLAYGCYSFMFNYCTSLTTAPVLPATTLANNCYYNMFADCTSLTTAPSILPATTLANNCYEGMFQGCRSLTTAPQLPATTLADYCYTGMFNGCTSLNYIQCLATDTSATNCTDYWVYGVANNGTFVKDANMSAWTTGNSGVPSGWTLINDGFKWTPTQSGLLSSSGVTYSGSTWAFGTDADGDYYTNNGLGEMIPLGYQINGTERFRIKFKYNHTDGRQLLGNYYGYNDGQFTYRFFLYNGQTFDLGSISEGHHRISTQISAENVLLDYEIGNYYIKEYNGSVIVQGTPVQYVAPSDNMLYVGTDGDSTIKIYEIAILN